MRGPPSSEPDARSPELTAAASASERGSQFDVASALISTRIGFPFGSAYLRCADDIIASPGRIGRARGATLVGQELEPAPDRDGSRFDATCDARRPCRRDRPLASQVPSVGCRWASRGPPAEPTCVDVAVALGSMRAGRTRRGGDRTVGDGDPIGVAATAARQQGDLSRVACPRSARVDGHRLADASRIKEPERCHPPLPSGRTVMHTGPHAPRRCPMRSYLVVGNQTLAGPEPDGGHRGADRSAVSRPISMSSSRRRRSRVASRGTRTRR